MVELAVASEDGPDILGVYLSCVRNYATLDDIDLEPARKDRVFFGLLNARVVLGCLRAALQLHGFAYPEDVSRVRVVQLPDNGLAELRVATSGKQLFEWAVEHESNICDAIDSFGGFDSGKLVGDDSLGAIQLLRPNAMLVGDKAVAGRSLLMLGDLQNLTHRQRSTLLRTFAQQRAGVGIWLAERFEALSPDEMLASGATEGRDYDEEVLIERFWRKYPKRFESLATNIADRRVAVAVEVDVSSLEGCLPGSLDGPQWRQRFSDIVEVVRKRTVVATAGSDVFSEWIHAPITANATGEEQAVGWRILEILIHRELRKRQQAFDFPLSHQDLEARTDSAVRAAAQLFIAHEFKVPYYFGISRLTTLASSNLEQFLRLCGDEFEEVVAASIIRKPSTLSPERQDAILRKASEDIWREVPRRAKHGEDVSRLLESIGRFSRDTTYQPNAPYSPGVTGIAISMKERAYLLDRESGSQTQEYKVLADVLASALAQNLLEAHLDYRVKGSDWMVLYLNRVLCARHDLPLQYGGFREKALKDLYIWMTQGYRSPRKALIT
jgi:hypothetical protein